MIMGGPNREERENEEEEVEISNNSNGFGNFVKKAFACIGLIAVGFGIGRVGFPNTKILGDESEAGKPEIITGDVIQGTTTNLLGIPQDYKLIMSNVILDGYDVRNDEIKEMYLSEKNGDDKLTIKKPSETLIEVFGIDR